MRHLSLLRDEEAHSMKRGLLTFLGLQGKMRISCSLGWGVASALAPQYS